jgi:Tfp pilus assembly protein PilF
MPRWIALLLLLVSAHAWARDAPPWVEVRSPHFSVVTDDGEREGRRLADQFERMRWVFQTLFPRANVDPIAPIVVIAVKNQKGMQALEPEAYLAKGQLAIAGLFLRAPDKNYILVRMDVEGEHPYSTVYHEYTHLELGTEGMPLWLNEGLAEFFQNTDFRDKEVVLGQASADDLMYLQQNRLIALPALFQVDANSPYYHEEQKGSVFYSESWALTHYLEVTDYSGHTNHVGNYLNLVSRQVDPVTAAEQAFGDLKKLQAALEDYIRRRQYMYFHMNSAGASIDPNSMTVTPVAQPQADAIRADFLAYNGRTDAARTLLDAVLKADPNNVQAHETMGFIEFRAGHRDEAKKWYSQAVALDSHNYLAQYYFGSLSVMDGSTGDDVESSLRTAIKLNPRFAPAYDSLAVLYGKRHEKLDEAHMLNLQAVQLEPGNVNFRLNAANILMEQGHYDDSVHVLEAARVIAKTPLEVDVVERVLKQVQQQQAQTEEWKRRQAETQVQTTVVTQGPVGKQADGVGANEEQSAPKHPTETPHGPDLMAQGVIRSVHCNRPGVLELRVEGAKGSVSLYSNDAYKIDYRALNFTPKDVIHPCQDLEGMKARVHYFRTADKTVDGQITIIALSK